MLYAIDPKKASCFTSPTLSTVKYSHNVEKCTVVIMSFVYGIMWDGFSQESIVY